jgi:hypothetical protein
MDIECCPLSAEELAQQSIQIHAENIGGIDWTDVEASADVTALTGRNATNRTSLLQEVMVAIPPHSKAMPSRDASNSPSATANTTGDIK